MAVETLEGVKGEKVLQFSVFMENRVGRLLEIIRLFSANNVHALALTILDTADSAILRLVVDDPEKARILFREHGFGFTETRLVVVEMSRVEVELQGVLNALLQAECNIHFTYAFLIRPRGRTALALHVDDDDVASHVLADEGFRVLNRDDLSR
jgi:hypothetical protein